jgi:AcrR family transcriptional regulator
MGERAGLSAAAGKRPYRMRARADAVAATRTQILDAAERAVDELPVEDVTLALIAARAGVSVQTLLRHFGSRDELFVATVQQMATKMGGDRDVEPTDGTAAIVATLFDHYERYGDRILWMLAQEDRHPQVKLLTDFGRFYHAEWCRQAFEPALRELSGERLERRLSQIVAATDLYVWKILRRDRLLSVAETKLAVRELLEPLLGAAE